MGTTALNHRKVVNHNVMFWEAEDLYVLLICKAVGCNCLDKRKKEPCSWDFGSINNSKIGSVNDPGHSEHLWRCNTVAGFRN